MQSKFLRKKKKTDSLSMKASSYNILIKNKFFFIYVVLKLIFLELIFSPVLKKIY